MTTKQPDYSSLYPIVEFIPGRAADEGVRPGFLVAGEFACVVMDSDSQYARLKPRPVIYLNNKITQQTHKVIGTGNLRDLLGESDVNVGDWVTIRWMGKKEVVSPYGKEYYIHLWEVKKDQAHSQTQLKSTQYNDNASPVESSTEAVTPTKTHSIYVQLSNYTKYDSSSLLGSKHIRVVYLDENKRHVHTDTFDDLSSARHSAKGFVKVLKASGVVVIETSSKGL